MTGPGQRREQQEVRSPLQDPHQTRTLAGGESAPLIRARSVVRVHEGPPVVPHLRIKAFLATRSGPSCVEENVFIARTRDLTCFLPRSAGPRGVMRGWLCRVPKSSKRSARRPE